MRGIKLMDIFQIVILVVCIYFIVSFVVVSVLSIWDIYKKNRDS